MMARNHAISGAASFVMLTGGAALLSEREWTTPVGEGIGFAASEVVRFMLDGHEPFSIWMLACTILFAAGCFLPDVDSNSSLVGRHLRLPVSHRTWFHSLWSVIGLLAAGWGLYRPLCWLALGWLVHLFWDSLSRQGVCWFYPYPGFIEYESRARVKRGHWLWLYRANTFAENVVTAVSVAGGVAVFVLVCVHGLIPMGFG